MIRARSQFFRTPAFPKGSGPDFVNAAVALETDLSAAELLARLHEVEAEHGRVRRDRWSQRCLDLDLIAMDALVLPSRGEYMRWVKLPLSEQMRLVPGELVLPHPRMQDRAFVLVPLAEVLESVAPNWQHPVTGATVAAMLEALPAVDVAEVVALP